MGIAGGLAGWMMTISVVSPRAFGAAVDRGPDRLDREFRIPTADGELVVLDGASASRRVRRDAGYIAFWWDRPTGEVYVYDRMMTSSRDLLKAADELERGMGVEIVEGLDLPSSPPALRNQLTKRRQDGDVGPHDRHAWLPATPLAVASLLNLPPAPERPSIDDDFCPCDGETLDDGQEIVAALPASDPLREIANRTGIIAWCNCNPQPPGDGNNPCSRSPDPACCRTSCLDWTGCTIDNCSGGECSYSPACPNSGDFCTDEYCNFNVYNPGGGVCLVASGERSCPATVVVDGAGYPATFPYARSACVNIPQGTDCVRVRIYYFSREYPVYTGRQSEFNDIVAYTLSVPGIGVSSGSARVNDLQSGFGAGPYPGGNYLVRDSAYSLGSQTEFGPVTIGVRGTATNIGDALLGSGVAFEVVCGGVDIEFPGVAEEDELDPGGKLFVNDDDDNGNGIADKDEPATAALAGEDDLVAVTISLTGPPFPEPIELSSPGGSSHIKVYANADRTSPLTLPHEWDPEQQFPVNVYVEGVSASGSPRDVQLRVRRDSCDDTLKLTVIGVTSLTWEKAVPANADLSSCPNNGGVRIFPEWLTPNDNPNPPNQRQQVKLVARIQPALADVTVHFTALDVDDPFDQKNPTMPNVGVIDANTIGNDNDGGGSTLSAQSALTGANGQPPEQASVVLTVSMQPGDNFRAAASVLLDAMSQNTIYAGQTVTPQQHADALSIDGDFNDYSCPRRWSPMLSVWRKLHVELDSMGPVTGNEIVRVFTDISGTGTTLTAATGINSINDGSLDLDTEPPDNGRFENGTFTVGTVPSTITIAPILANGHTRVEFASSSIAGLPFTAVDNDDFWNGIISGTIADVTKGGGNFIWTLTITSQNENPIDWPDFIGGTLEVGGGSEVQILGSSATAPQLRTDALNIPCRIHDDDDDTLLPKLPDVSAMATAYEPAYVVPVYDVGDNNMNVAFVLNVWDNESALNQTYDWDSRSFNTGEFWVAYLLEAYQSQAPDADSDPESEGSNLGSTPAANGGSLIFLEVHQAHEGRSNPTFDEQVTVVHESGHAVGGSDEHPVTSNNDMDSMFVANYLKHIRSAPRPDP